MQKGYTYMRKDIFKKMKQDPYYLGYHLMPPQGWLNDPNGLCEMNGIYHIFYQYSYDANGGVKHWGHYTTKDFINYTIEDIPLYPDDPTDRSGVYSGAAIIHNGMHLFYTGNVKEEGDYDYTHAGRKSYVNYVYSQDGLHFSKKETLLSNDDYPKNMTCHVRDPKVIEKNGTYYMYLGARDNNDIGCALIYASKDLKHWSYAYTIYSDQPFGYMWECPAPEILDNEEFLITCPQGIQPDGILYENYHQNGYFKIKNQIAYDYETLDYGFDFYAPQSFVDHQGRHILIGWMGLPDHIFKNPTIEYGWQMTLSLPRKLKNVDGHIYQYPIDEILSLKEDTQFIDCIDTPQNIDKQCMLEFDCDGKPFVLTLGNLEIKYEDHVFSLEHKWNGYDRTIRHVQLDDLKQMDIFLDASTIEIFLNHGQKVISSRVFNPGTCSISSNRCMHLQYTKMKSFQYK